VVRVDIQVLHESGRGVGSKCRLRRSYNDQGQKNLRQVFHVFPCQLRIRDPEETLSLRRCVIWTIRHPISMYTAPSHALLEGLLIVTGEPVLKASSAAAYARFSV